MDTSDIVKPLYDQVVQKSLKFDILFLQLQHIFWTTVYKQSNAESTT